MSVIRGAKGLTLVEILVCVALILILVTATASAVISSRFLSAYAKHKAQATYTAQMLIEQTRRLPFASIASVAATPITLDDMGTSATAADDFLGTAIMTVTTTGVYTKTVQVEIDWLEQITSGKVTMKEFFTTTIANESELN